MEKGEQSLFINQHIQLIEKYAPQFLTISKKDAQEWFQHDLDFSRGTNFKTAQASQFACLLLLTEYEKIFLVLCNTQIRQGPNKS